MDRRDLGARRSVQSLAAAAGTRYWIHQGRLSTVRTYAKLAAKVGAISAEESILIASVQGYANKEARHVDEKRRAENIQTRVGHKKAEALKQQPNTPQGQRDALLMCLLLDHRLRVGEVAILPGRTST